MKKILNQLRKVIPFGLFIMGFIVGLAVMYLYMQPKLAYWVNNYNQAFASPVFANLWYNAGHDSGCVDGLVVSGVFMTQKDADDQIGSLLVKIGIEKLNNPYQANIDNEELNSLQTKYKYQQEIITNCMKIIKK